MKLETHIAYKMCILILSHRVEAWQILTRACLYMSITTLDTVDTFIELTQSPLQRCNPLVYYSIKKVRICSTQERLKLF